MAGGGPADRVLAVGRGRRVPDRRDQGEHRLPGWRDLKIGVFARRKAGPGRFARRLEPAGIAGPTARSRVRGDRGDRGIRAPLGRVGRATRADILRAIERDRRRGAEWIWNAAAEQFPGHRGVLDFFHACQHVAATADVLHGPGTAASRAWFEATRRALLGDGWYGVQEQIGRTLAGPISDAGRTAVEALTRYLAAQSNRINYRLRLARGEPIGSGDVIEAPANT